MQPRKPEVDDVVDVLQAAEVRRGWGTSILITNSMGENQVERSCRDGHTCLGLGAWEGGWHLGVADCTSLLDCCGKGVVVLLLIDHADVCCAVVCCVVVCRMRPRRVRCLMRLSQS
jgi:hypothetical protein